jgi:CRISPR-associated protein (TIGR03984 family)
MNPELWKPIPVEVSFSKDPRAWLAGHMYDQISFLLAHANDGVIWGRLQGDGTLKLSSDVYNDPKKYPSLAVPLTSETLQQARLFGPDGELFLWRRGGGFIARMIADGPQPSSDTLPDEEYLLWGDQVRASSGDFTILVEGQRGLAHAVPPIENQPPKGRVALVVRHYIDYDDQNQAYVALSRLVNLIRR